MTESTELLPQLKASNYSCDTSNFVFSTVMPPGTHTAVTRALQTYFPSRSYSFLTAEGYYAGKLFVAVMKEALRKNCPDLKDFKKKCFLDTLYERGVWDVGIELGPYYRPGQRSDTPEGCNQGMQHVCEEQQTASHQRAALIDERPTNQTDVCVRGEGNGALDRARGLVASEELRALLPRGGKQVQRAPGHLAMCCALYYHRCHDCRVVDPPQATPALEQKP